MGDCFAEEGGFIPRSHRSCPAPFCNSRFWLLGLSTMVWRRVQAPATFTLRQFHGVIQVAMGWEGASLSITSARDPLWFFGAFRPVSGDDAGGLAAAPEGAIHLEI